MTPSIGRIVHYVAKDGQDAENHYAAIVTHVWSNDVVNLEVFSKGTQAIDAAVAGTRQSVMHDDKFGDHTWHEPERVTEASPKPVTEAKADYGKEPAKK